MNERTVAKFNLYVSVILLALLLLFFVGATLAYFSDTKQATATLTAGNVRITLSESAVKEEGWNLVPDPESPRIFGGDGEITDAMFDEVKRFAAFLKQREAGK